MSGTPDVDKRSQTMKTLKEEDEMLTFYRSVPDPTEQDHERYVALQLQVANDAGYETVHAYCKAMESREPLFIVPDDFITREEEGKDST
jgi:hypothetical protein